MPFLPVFLQYHSFRPAFLLQYPFLPSFPSVLSFFLSVLFFFLPFFLSFFPSLPYLTLPYLTLPYLFLLFLSFYSFPFLPFLQCPSTLSSIGFGKVKASRRLVRPESEEQDPVQCEGGLSFGLSMAPLGDWDADGVPDLIVGGNKKAWILLLKKDGSVKKSMKVSYWLNVVCWNIPTD
jgi:hypothetical protein